MDEKGPARIIKGLPVFTEHALCPDIPHACMDSSNPPDSTPVCAVAMTISQMRKLTPKEDK